MPPVLSAPPKEPKTFAELFTFYHDYVKVLYSAVQTENALPQEVLFEINAAFDHLSRYWIYGDSEVDAVHKCYGHLKRSCLDIFKVAVREARNQYDQLGKLDTSTIDNGEFDKNLRSLFAEIKIGATEARRLEGNGKSDANGPIKAFDAWQPVYANCLRLETEYFNHPALDWARRHWWQRVSKASLVAGAVGFVGGVFGREVAPSSLLHWVLELFNFAKTG